MSTKLCSDCRQLKSIVGFAKDRSARDGLQARCRICSTIRWKKYYEKHRDHLIHARQEYRRTSGELRKKRYGVGPEAFQNLLLQQNNCCASCGDKLGSHPHLDHCHSTSIVRGILCSSCNQGLGYFKDSIQRLQKAIEYLQRFSK